MQDLEQRLAEWTERGLLSSEQAAAIATHERKRGPSRPAGSASDVRPDRPSRRLAVAEALGYVGAALALAALATLLGERWPELNVGGRLAMVGLLALLPLGAGQAVHGQPAPAMQRLTGVLWAASALGGAWFVGIVAAEVVDAGPEATTTAVGLVAMLVAVPLLLRRPSLPLQVVGLAGAATVAVSALNLAALRPDVFWSGLLVVGLGGAWLLLGRGGWIAPRRTAEVLGALAALMGAQTGSWGDLHVPALVIALTIAGGLVALAVLGDAGHHLVVGALGLFTVLPQLVFELFGDAIGAPATLLVVGLLLVLLAVGLGRVRREVGILRDGATHGDGGGSRAADGGERQQAGR